MRNWKYGSKLFIVIFIALSCCESGPEPMVDVTWIEGDWGCCYIGSTYGEVDIYDQSPQYVSSTVKLTSQRQFSISFEPKIIPDLTCLIMDASENKARKSHCPVMTVCSLDHVNFTVFPKDSLSIAETGKIDHTLTQPGLHQNHFSVALQTVKGHISIKLHRFR